MSAAFSIEQEVKIYRILILTSLALFTATPAQAEGDDLFRNSKACHSVIDGKKVIILGGETAPNLFGVINRQAAALSDYDYSDGLRRAGELGLVWTVDNFVAFTANPNRFLFEHTGKDLRSKMPFARAEGIEDLAHYLGKLTAKSN